MTKHDTLGYLLSALLKPSLEDELREALPLLGLSFVSTRSYSNGVVLDFSFEQGNGNAHYWSLEVVGQATFEVCMNELTRWKMHSRENRYHFVPMGRSHKRVDGLSGWCNTLAVGTPVMKCTACGFEQLSRVNNGNA